MTDREHPMVTKCDDTKVVIFRPWITTKDGRKIWAKWFGKKAFRIELDPDAETAT